MSLLQKVAQLIADLQTLSTLVDQVKAKLTALDNFLSTI